MKKGQWMSALLLCGLCGCSTISVNESGGEVSGEYVKSVVGSHACVMMCLDRDMFNYYKAAMNRSIDGLPPAEKAKAFNKYDGWQWEENRYFMFELLHAAPYDIRKGDFTFRMDDAAGANQIDDVMFTRGHFADGVQTKNWFIRAKKAVTTANFSPEELPVTLTVKFFKGQRKEYRITPNK